MRFRIFDRAATAEEVQQALDMFADAIESAEQAERAGPEFINTGSYEFHDIEGEIERTYTWPDGGRIVVTGVRKLAVSANGHRLWCDDGSCHYVPVGWRAISWRTEEGAPDFSL